jgi:hypothetical protein
MMILKIALQLRIAVPVYPPPFAMSILKENPLNFSRRMHNLWPDGLDKGGSLDR